MSVPKKQMTDYCQVIESTPLDNAREVVAEVCRKMSRYLGPHFVPLYFTSPMIAHRMARRDYSDILTWGAMSLYRGRFQLFTTSAVITLLASPFVIDFFNPTMIEYDKDESGFEGHTSFEFSFHTQKETLIFAKITYKKELGKSFLIFKLTKEFEDSSEFSFSHDFSHTETHANLLHSIHDTILEIWRSE